MTIKCKTCGKDTGPVFGKCSECVQKEDADLAARLASQGAQK